MKRINAVARLPALVAALSAAPVMAADFDVSIQNVTRGIYFTPLLVAAHDSGTRLFSIGSAASANLQAMAEGGDISGLEADLTAVAATQSNNPAGGLLAPGDSTTVTLNTDGAPANTQLSIAGMLLPTNDGFVAANSLTLPTAAGEYTYYLNGYDAGTEANDEIRGSGTPGQAGFPVPGPLDSAVGTNGTGLPATAEGFVHIHRGVIGDTDASGGLSDIDSTLHRWLTPVAKLTITVR
ncbi:MAG: spondin domain-containing protein [Ketobacteraceae bacterium]|nr:spondin domain-containing protein [Ketobacteraceae bacterium]